MNIEESGMPEANVVAKHTEVLGADGVHVGTVDHLDDDRIKLSRADSNDAQHYYVSTALVQDIRGNTLTLVSPRPTPLAPTMSDVVLTSGYAGEDKQVDPAKGAGEDEGGASQDGKDDHLKEDQKPTRK
jgi:hypothetical protein